MDSRVFRCFSRSSPLPAVVGLRRTGRSPEPLASPIARLGLFGNLLPIHGQSGKAAFADTAAVILEVDHDGVFAGR
jgi:hypothetical protein